MGPFSLGDMIEFGPHGLSLFDDLKVGDTVEFSTSGKYNPGFHATEKYVGCVEWIKGSECAIKTGKGIAVVLIKHVERIVK